MTEVPGEDIAPKAADRSAALSSLSDLRKLLAMVDKPRWTTPALIVLGLVSSFAETVGITLILLFLYTASGQVSAAQGDGLMGQFLREAVSWFGSTTDLALMILLLIIARGLLALLYTRISSAIGERISESVRNRIHKQYLTVSYAFVQKHEQAELMEVLGTESWVIASAYAGFTRLIINSCSILVFVGFLLGISVPITLTAVSGTLLIATVLRFFANPARSFGSQVKGAHRLLGEHMLVTLQGMRTIRAYGQEDYHHRRFTDASARARESSLAMLRLSAWIGPLTEIGYLAILCTIIAAAGWWHTSFAITLGAVVLLYRLQPHVRELESNLLYIAQVQPQLRSVWEMIEEQDKEYPAAGTLPVDALHERLAFCNVDFSYGPDQPRVLDGVTFDIPAGKTTALIGASGAGKTTIVNLLLRLYSPVSGHIEVDGVRLEDCCRTDWVRMIGVAGQDVDLVEGTVLDNIMMAREDATEEEAIAAARRAGVAEFVENLPYGFEEWVGQEGLRFSGGQRQRIGLARAILRRPAFMILDEAMSALDRDLEDRVRAAIDTHMHGRTMLIITHRLETVKTVDHIVWIDDGKVQGSGPPADLMARSPRLASIFGNRKSDALTSA
ncbi:ABC transporter ATP-binding protein [Sphingobium limneticum]|uniref:ABC transporter ATP-binding protein n=1 Tax=Sphingobium limneticum TaxID=1007511 RepID=UPI00123CDC33|nr:ABC transporter ATP-binding protein [Sphingobium limneticum]KAA9013015.1 ABC transporter ATP-binding protein [Sphingobium limneticum]